MKVSVLGNDTLAAATTECCAKHHTMVNPNSDPDVIWICYDVPLDEKGADYPFVMQQICRDVALCISKPVYVISSQMPVGTTRVLEETFPEERFVYIPENIRVATAVQDFQNQPRIVIGTRTLDNDKLIELVSPFTKNIIITTPETAEMIKHAINCWLGMNIAFINEIAKVGNVVGASMDILTEAMKADPRIGAKAPLKAGAPFGGGHLERDIAFLSHYSKELGINLPIINHILPSNAS
jgi:nucleotide sugar dehydrogenase